jgi:hypothetical protein
VQQESSISTKGLPLNYRREKKLLESRFRRAKERLDDGFLHFRARAHGLTYRSKMKGDPRHVTGREASAKYGERKHTRVALLNLIRSRSENHEGMITLGLDPYGHQIRLNLLNSEVGNVLISGMKGAGKTSLLRTIGASVSLENRQSSVQLGVVDVHLGNRLQQKDSESLRALGQAPHSIFPVIRTVLGGLDVIDFLTEELDYRQDKKITSPLMVVMIDGLENILTDANRVLFRKLGHLLNHGPEFGFRLFLSIEDPIAKEVRPLLKYDFQLRLLGRAADQDRAWAAAGLPGTRAEMLNGAGEFIAVRGDICRKFQGAYVAEEDLPLTDRWFDTADKKVILANPTSIHLSGQGAGGPRRLSRETSDKKPSSGINGRKGSQSEWPDNSGSDSWLTADWLDRFWMERE